MPRPPQPAASDGDGDGESGDGVHGGRTKLCRVRDGQILEAVDRTATRQTEGHYCVPWPVPPWPTDRKANGTASLHARGVLIPFLPDPNPETESPTKDP